MLRAPTLRRAVASVPRSRAFSDYSPADDPGAHLRGKKKEPAPYKVVETSPIVDEDGKERSAIFGAYPTRRKLNRVAARLAAKVDRSEAWRRDPVCEYNQCYTITFVQWRRIGLSRHSIICSMDRWTALTHSRDAELAEAALRRLRPTHSER